MTTPVPSSDAAEPSSSQENHNANGGAEDATPKAKVCSNIKSGAQKSSGQKSDANLFSNTDSGNYKDTCGGQQPVS